MNQKLNNIQGLRAFAAFAVVYVHMQNQGARYGWVGVDLFFVISGFIMAGICETRPENFMKRRFIRIIPLYWVSTLGVFLVAISFPHILQSPNSKFTDLVKSLLFIPFRRGDGQVQPVLFLGWTLNLEMYFYCILGFSLWIYKKYAPWVAVGLVLIVFFLLFPFRHQNTLAGFYSNLQVLDFCYGIIGYHLFRWTSNNLGLYKKLSIASLFFLALSGLLFVQISKILQHFPTRLGLISVIIVTSAGILSKNGWDISWKPIVLVGDASYVIYLLHPYIVRLINIFFVHKLPSHTTDRSFFTVILTYVVITVVSVLIYLKEEKPAVDWLNRKFARSARLPSDPAVQMG